jgi:hypothetical protein
LEREAEKKEKVRPCAACLWIYWTVKNFCAIEVRAAAQMFYCYNNTQLNISRKFIKRPRRTTAKY